MTFRVGHHSYEFPNGGSIDFFERRVAAAAFASELLCKTRASEILCKTQNAINNIVSSSE